MREYAASLDVPGDAQERAARLSAAAQAADAQPLPAKTGFSCLAELDLARLQQALGTNYDLSP